MLKWLNGDVSDKGRIGITFGCMDLLHAGHVVMLEEAKRHCDYLIVGLQTDPTIDRPDKNKPIQSLLERQIQVNGCRYVDETIVYAITNYQNKWGKDKFREI